jgi:hypothetical protein
MELERRAAPRQWTAEDVDAALRQRSALWALPEAERPEFVREAREALARGRFRAIVDLTGEILYLVRFWPGHAEMRRRSGDGSFASDNCRMLHFFASADPGRALHDHPWGFRSRILAGGYVEERPIERLNDDGTFAGYYHASIRTTLPRHASEAFQVAATQPHCVAAVCFDTWTEVETGPLERQWGFYPDGKFVDYWKHLGLPNPFPPGETF